MTEQAQADRPGPIRSVLIVDDHPLYSDALASALELVFDTADVRKVNSFGAALDGLDAGFAPDLVMFDLKLPDVSGISGFLKLRDRVPETPILVISSLTSAEVVQALMDEGAAGFLPKDAPTAELRTALTDIGVGRKYLPKGYSRSGPSSPCASAPAEPRPSFASLTPQQRRILKLICAGMLNKQIAHELSLTEATVKAHVTALLRRLGVKNRTQAAVMFDGVGLNGAATPSERDAAAFLRQ